MNPEEIQELLEVVKEYKPALDAALDEYGNDIEGYIIRLVTSMAHIQKVYYEQLIKEGFSNLQAFTLLLEARNAMKNIDLASRSK